MLHARGSPSSPPRVSPDELDAFPRNITVPHYHSSRSGAPLAHTRSLGSMAHPHIRLHNAKPAYPAGCCTSSCPGTLHSAVLTTTARTEVRWRRQDSFLRSSIVTR